MNRRSTRRAEIILSYGPPIFGLVAMLIAWLFRLFVED